MTISLKTPHCPNFITHPHMAIPVENSLHAGTSVPTLFHPAFIPVTSSLNHSQHCPGLRLITQRRPASNQLNIVTLNENFQVRFVFCNDSLDGNRLSVCWRWRFYYGCNGLHAIFTVTNSKKDIHCWCVHCKAPFRTLHGHRRKCSITTSPDRDDT